MTGERYRPGRNIIAWTQTASGRKRLNRDLNEDQHAALVSQFALTYDPARVIAAHHAAAEAFLLRARQLLAMRGLPGPEKLAGVVAQCLDGPIEIPPLGLSNAFLSLPTAVADTVACR